MQLIPSFLSPPVTSMIRFDHAQVTAAYHRYHPGLSPARKRGIAGFIAVMLEVHAQLEEELFYPAFETIAPDTTLVSKSYREHQDLREAIDKLRATDAGDARHDELLAELMREVLHHVADEESTLLPAAERLMPERLRELGARMTERRVQLLAVRGGTLFSAACSALPDAAMVAAWTGGAAPAYLFDRAR